jgi:hypothetical protein
LSYEAMNKPTPHREGAKMEQGDEPCTTNHHQQSSNLPRVLPLKWRRLLLLPLQIVPLLPTELVRPLQHALVQELSAKGFKKMLSGSVAANVAWIAAGESSLRIQDQRFWEAVQTACVKSCAEPGGVTPGQVGVGTVRNLIPTPANPPTLQVRVGIVYEICPA